MDNGKSVRDRINSINQNLQVGQPGQQADPRRNSALSNRPHNANPAASSTATTSTTTNSTTSSSLVSASATSTSSATPSAPDTLADMNAILAGLTPEQIQYILAQLQSPQTAQATRVSAPSATSTSSASLPTQQYVTFSAQQGLETAALPGRALPLPQPTAARLSVSGSSTSSSWTSEDDDPTLNLATQLALAIHNGNAIKVERLLSQGVDLYATRDVLSKKLACNHCILSGWSGRLVRYDGATGYSSIHDKPPMFIDKAIDYGNKKIFDLIKNAMKAKYQGTPVAISDFQEARFDAEFLKRNKKAAPENKEAAEDHAVTAQYEKLETYINEYRVKFNGLDAAWDESDKRIDAFLKALNDGREKFILKEMREHDRRPNLKCPLSLEDTFCPLSTGIMRNPFMTLTTINEKTEGTKQTYDRSWIVEVLERQAGDQKKDPITSQLLVKPPENCQINKEDIDTKLGIDRDDDMHTLIYFLLKEVNPPSFDVEAKIKRAEKIKVETKARQKLESEISEKRAAERAQRLASPPELRLTKENLLLALKESGRFSDLTGDALKAALFKAQDRLYFTPGSFENNPGEKDKHHSLYFTMRYLGSQGEAVIASRFHAFWEGEERDQIGKGNIRILEDNVVEGVSKGFQQSALLAKSHYHTMEEFISEAVAKRSTDIKLLMDSQIAILRSHPSFFEDKDEAIKTLNGDIFASYVLRKSTLQDTNTDPYSYIFAYSYNVPGVEHPKSSLYKLNLDGSLDYVKEVNNQVQLAEPREHHDTFIQFMGSRHERPLVKNPGNPVPAITPHQVKLLDAIESSNFKEVSSFINRGVVPPVEHYREGDKQFHAERSRASNKYNAALACAIRTEQRAIATHKNAKALEDAKKVKNHILYALYVKNPREFQTVLYATYKGLGKTEQEILKEMQERRELLPEFTTKHLLNAIADECQGRFGKHTHPSWHPNAFWEFDEGFIRMDNNPDYHAEDHYYLSIVSCNERKDLTLARFRFSLVLPANAEGSFKVKVTPGTPGNKKDALFEGQEDSAREFRSVAEFFEVCGRLGNNKDKFDWVKDLPFYKEAGAGSDAIGQAPATQSSIMGTHSASSLPAYQQHLANTNPSRNRAESSSAYPAPAVYLPYKGGSLGNP